MTRGDRVKVFFKNGRASVIGRVIFINSTYFIVEVSSNKRELVWLNFDRFIYLPTFKERVLDFIDLKLRHLKLYLRG